MTGLEYVLVVTFAAVWIVPAAMALSWERRLRAERRAHPSADPALKPTASTRHGPALIRARRP